MALWLCYVDEAYDSQKMVLSALMVKHRLWRDALSRLHGRRGQLNSEHGMFLRKEVHAHQFVSGRGKPSAKDIGKWQRSRIYLDLLKTAASLPEVRLINVCLDVTGRKDAQMDAWNRMLNRLERTLRADEEDEAKQRSKLVRSIESNADPGDVEMIRRRLVVHAPRAILIADEGKEAEITRAVRRMGVFNPVPSQVGAWADGATAKSIPTERIIEDPSFRDSRSSLFLQAVDHIAYALLKREVAPTPNIKRYGIHEMFDSSGLPQICVIKASTADPLGIVRK